MLGSVGGLIYSVHHLVFMLYESSLRVSHVEWLSEHWAVYTQSQSTNVRSYKAVIFVLLCLPFRVSHNSQDHLSLIPLHCGFVSCSLKAEILSRFFGGRSWAKSNTLLRILKKSRKLRILTNVKANSYELSNYAHSIYNWNQYADSSA